MYLLVLAKTNLPSSMPSRTVRSDFLVRMMSAADLATSEALLTAIPTSADLRAGPSFTPSPMKPTVLSS